LNVLQSLRDKEGLSPHSASQLLLALARYGNRTSSAVSLAEIISPPEPSSTAEPSRNSKQKPSVVAETSPEKRLETIVNAAWALGVLGHATAPVTQRIGAEVADALAASMAAPTAAGSVKRAARPPPARLLRKAYHAQMLLRHGGGDLPLAVDVASAAAAEWAVALWPDDTSGRVQQRFTRFLDAMQVPYMANVPAADGRLRVDVLLSRSGDQVRPMGPITGSHLLCQRDMTRDATFTLPMTICTVICCGF
jgi:hypothetical protein